MSGTGATEPGVDDSSPPNPQAPKARVLSLLSRREIEDRIARGQNIIILNGEVLNCNAWMPYHPGGDKAIRHMVGRDATDEVTALHSPEARLRMNAYRIGRIDGRWANFVPPIQGGKFRLLGATDSEDSTECSSVVSSGKSTPNDELRRRSVNLPTPPSSVSSVDQDDRPHMSLLDARTREELDQDLDKYPSLDPLVQDEIVRKYRALGEKIKAENLYQCNYWAYAVECSRYLTLFFAWITLLHLGWYKLSAIFLGLFWHQLTFTAHDAGHMGITHNFHVDTLIGIFVADFLGGLSIGWWKRNHNVHHIVTNSPEHDPDIQHIPFFAVSHRFLENLRSTYYDHIMKIDAVAKVTLTLQHHLYYVILSFGRFNLYRLSWQYLVTGQAPRKGPAWWHFYLELLGQTVFWTWFGYLIVYKTLPTNADRWAFVLISHIASSPVHVQITLSHFCMSTADLGVNESFPQKMLRTTMDVECPPWLDFVHGGLQFQAIHHLFPRIPRHNLRKTQRLVQEFCEDVKIPYAVYGFVDGNKAVIGRLEEIARQAAIYKQCQKSMAESNDYGMH